MKSCKVRVHVIENECFLLTRTLEALMNNEMPQDKFSRTLIRAAREIDHVVTDLYNLSHELAQENFTAVSQHVSAIKRDFSQASKKVWDECVKPYASSASKITKDSLEKIRGILKEIMSLVKNDIKRILSTDSEMHQIDTHESHQALKLKAVHKKYEKKKKEDTEAKE